MCVCSAILSCFGLYSFLQLDGSWRKGSGCPPPPGGGVVLGVLVLFAHVIEKIRLFLCKL